MQVCPILSERDVLDRVHFCPSSFLSRVDVNRIIDTGSFGLVLIITTPDQRKYAVKLEAVQYNPAVQERIVRTLRQKQRVVSLNEIIFQEVTALCRVSALVQDGIADQFPIIYDYHVCPMTAIPPPFNRRLLAVQQIPTDSIEASTIVMSYISGESVLSYHQATQRPLPMTCQFDCLYGIFALVLRGHLNLMLDLDVQNLLLTDSAPETYFQLLYSDETDEPSIIRLRFPKGTPRLRFIDFGAAIPLPQESYAQATVYALRSALDPIHLIKFYSFHPDWFPVLSIYRAQLERPTRPMAMVWNFFCNYVVEPYLEEYRVTQIPPQAQVFQMSLV
jgi:hypothetical protein